MREILFRAKAINRIEGREYRTRYKNGDWVFGLLSKPYHDFNGYIQPAEMRNTDGVDGIDVDHETLGQFTGLTDKNGVKIFEGDLMAQDSDTEPLVVKYEDGIFIAELANRKDWVFIYEAVIWEIVGNIYDNPELVGGDDNA